MTKHLIAQTEARAMYVAKWNELITLKTHLRRLRNPRAVVQMSYRIQGLRCAMANIQKIARAARVPSANVVYYQPRPLGFNPPCAVCGQPVGGESDRDAMDPIFVRNTDGAVACWHDNRYCGSALRAELSLQGFGAQEVRAELVEA